MWTMLAYIVVGLVVVGYVLYRVFKRCPQPDCPFCYGQCLENPDSYLDDDDDEWTEENWRAKFRGTEGGRD